MYACTCTQVAVWLFSALHNGHARLQVCMRVCARTRGFVGLGDWQWLRRFATKANKVSAFYTNLAAHFCAHLYICLDTCLHTCLNACLHTRQHLETHFQKHDVYTHVHTHVDPQNVDAAAEGTLEPQTRFIKPQNF